jgi:HD-like signal output (HDOD) protein
MGATSNVDKAAIVESAISSISHIATLPEITLRIIEMVEDPTSTAQDLHSVISNDPALCSRILKVVNSAFYGLPRQIGSINRAIVLLGLNAVKNIAIAASLTKLYRGGDLCDKFSARQLWEHSMATAAASKMICDELRLGLPDEAFLAGLMHDIGLMVELQSRRTDLLRVFEALEVNLHGVPMTDMRELEQQILGADHQDFGSGLCERWKFPRSFISATGYHHDPTALPAGNRTLTSIVYLADRIAARLGYGFRGDLPDLEPQGAVLDELGITQEQIDKMADRLPKVYEEVEATFG